MSFVHTQVSNSGILSTIAANPTLLLALPILATLVVSFRSYLWLSHIPGPFFAKFTNFPRLLWVKSYKAHETHVKLHRQYGPIVRFGPNMVSVGDPKEMGTIYSFKQPWRKSDFYRALLLQSRNKPIEGIFATQNEPIHRMLKRPISNTYSMSNLLSFEPYVNTTMRLFLDQLERRFVNTTDDDGKSIPCNFSQWMQMFAFDVMGELTFSHAFGFLEKGEDIDGCMADLWNTLKKTLLLDHVWTNNPIARYLRGNIKSPGVVFAMKRVQERKLIERGELEKNWKLNSQDMLSRFMEVEAKDPNVPPQYVAFTDISHAIFLRAMFYHLLHNPKTLERLNAEFDEAAAAGKMDELAGFKQANDLPYFNACINEAGRIHTPLGLPLEREVPPQGAVVCGKHLKPGTVVGMTAWVVHRDPETFGDDCEEWWPERWLCEPEKKRKMENALLTFGAGHRNCIGKSIALLEIYKIVPTLLRYFNFELLSPEEGGDWTVYNRWFVTQRGFKVRLSRRASSGKC